MAAGDGRVPRGACPARHRRGAGRRRRRGPAAGAGDGADRLRHRRRGGARPRPIRRAGRSPPPSTRSPAATASPCWLACPTLGADGRVFNTVHLADRTGGRLARYAKTHLYGAVDRAQFAPGPALAAPVELDGWKLGLAICYDIEFPEVARALALAGAEAILVPTANMLPFESVATRLVPARAEENAVFLAYANYVGADDAFTYFGRSCVCDPDRRRPRPRRRRRGDDLRRSRQGRRWPRRGGRRRTSRTGGPSSTVPSPQPEVRHERCRSRHHVRPGLPLRLRRLDRASRRARLDPGGAARRRRWRSSARASPGVLAGYELMRMGAHPVLYESGQLGGRLRSQPFEGADGVIAELGGMRFPVSSTGFYHYVDKLGLESRPFPNPLTPAAGSTVIDLCGRDALRRDAGRPAAAVPRGRHRLRRGARGRREVLRPQGGDPRPRPGTDQGDLEPDRARLGRAHLLRLRGLVGGVPGPARSSTARCSARSASAPAAGIPTSPTRCSRSCGSTSPSATRTSASSSAASSRCRRGCGAGCRRRWSHWPAGTTLAALNGGAPRPGARRLFRDEAGRLSVTDRWGRTETFEAVIVTCQSWLMSTAIDTEERLFSQEMWMALDRTRYMQSSKTFVMVDRPFWRDRDPVTGRHVMSMTLTDRLTRGTYLFDLGEDRPGVICLTYSWMSDALKMLPLPVERRVELALGGAGEDLSDARHPRAHHRRPDHGELGERPELPRRLQGRAAGALPLQPPHVRAFHAGGAAAGASAGCSWPATTSAGPRPGSRARCRRR